MDCKAGPSSASATKSKVHSSLYSAKWQNFDEAWRHLFHPFILQNLRDEHIAPADYHSAFEQIYNFFLWHGDEFSDLPTKFLHRFKELLVIVLRAEVLSKIQPDQYPTDNSCAITEQFFQRWQNFHTVIHRFSDLFRLVDEQSIQQQQNLAHCRTSFSCAQDLAELVAQQTFNSHSSNLQTIHDISLQCWRTEIFDVLQHKLTLGVQNMVLSKYTPGMEVMPMNVKDCLFSYRAIILLLDDACHSSSSNDAAISAFELFDQSLFNRAFVQPYLDAVEKHSLSYVVSLNRTSINIDGDDVEWSTFVKSLAAHFDKELSDGKACLIGNDSRAELNDNYSCLSVIQQQHERNERDQYVLSKLKCLLCRLLIRPHVQHLRIFASHLVENFIPDDALNSACRLLMEIDGAVDDKSVDTDKKPRSSHCEVLRIECEKAVKVKLESLPFEFNKPTKSWLTNKHAAEQFVTTLAADYERLSTFVRSCIVCDADKFHLSIKTAFIHFLESTNQPHNNADINPASSAGRLLASYFDQNLRSKTVAVLDNELRYAFIFTSYLQNKDKFIQQYRSDLARRLLLKLSSDVDAEVSMLQKLRVFGGVSVDDLTSLMRMCNDMKISAEFNQEFRSYLLATSSATSQILPQLSTPAVDITVLNSSAWKGRHTTHSSMPNNNVMLPENVMPTVELIEKFYSKSHDNMRQLKLAPHFSLATIQIGGHVKRVSLSQLLILTALQTSGPSMSYDKLLLQVNGCMDEQTFHSAIMPFLFNPFETTTESLSQTVLTCSPPMPKVYTADLKLADYSIAVNNKKFMQSKTTMLPQHQHQHHDDYADNLVDPLYATIAPLADYDAAKNIKDRRIQQVILNIMRVKLSIFYQQLPSSDGSEDSTDENLVGGGGISIQALQTHVIDMLKSDFIPTGRMIRDQIEYMVKDLKCVRRDSFDSNLLHLSDKI